MLGGLIILSSLVAAVVPVKDSTSSGAFNAAALSDVASSEGSNNAKGGESADELKGPETPSPQNDSNPLLPTSANTAILNLMSLDINACGQTLSSASFVGLQSPTFLLVVAPPAFTYDLLLLNLRSLETGALLTVSFARVESDPDVLSSLGLAEMLNGLSPNLYISLGLTHFNVPPGEYGASIVLSNDEAQCVLNFENLRFLLSTGTVTGNPANESALKRGGGNRDSSAEMLSSTGGPCQGSIAVVHERDQTRSFFWMISWILAAGSIAFMLRRRLG